MAGADLLSQLKILTRVGVVGDLSDGQLLQRFLTARDGTAQAAFTALAGRHGPMVLSVCRRVLGDPHDAQDAFQATFLVLAHKAGSVRQADSVASWLHGVALRIADRVKADAIRRRAHERRGAALRGSSMGREIDRPESWPELHEEIARLPDRYREPLVLYYLEGLSTAEAARRLHCPHGTILSRLSRGRERLRDRLTRRGLAPTAGLVAPGLFLEPARTLVPETLLSATAQAATQIREGSGTSGLLSAPVRSLTEGMLRAMLWTKLKTGGLAGLALAALTIGAGATLAYQETRKEDRSAPSKNAPNEPVTAKHAGPSAAVIVPLPPRAELRELLHRAAGEAAALAKAKPGASSWTLTTIATAQAKAGDLEGARATFANAASEAGGSFGGAANAWGLWRVGHYQAESGLKEDARATLLRAFEAIPGVVGDYGKDSRTLETLAVIAQEQAGIGAREDARRTANRLLEFSEEFFKATNIGNARDWASPSVAAALAAVGDFEAAFGWSNREGDRRGGDVLGKIAEAASERLDPDLAQRFVREAAKRLAKLEWVDETYFGLDDLAKAQARLGDVDAAKRSALAIGEGPSRDNNDLTSGQPYALFRIAIEQSKQGDTAGARETLRDGFRSVRDHPMMRGRDGRYQQIAYGQVANGDIDGALRSVEAMDGPTFRSEILAWIARAQAAAGKHDDARATFARALADAGLSVKTPPEPNPDLAKSGANQNMPASARMTLAEIQAIAGDVPGALKTIRSIDDPHYQRFALNKVVSARATAGDVAGALRLGLDEAKTPEERRSALEGLGNGVYTRLSHQTLDPRAE